MDLTDCGLRPNDAQALAACFPANTKCTAVLLDSNRLGDVGFAAVLQVRCFLRQAAAHTHALLLRDAVSQALADNPRITSLSSAYAARPTEPHCLCLKSTERIVVILCGSYNGITARCAEALKSFGAKNIKCQVALHVVHCHLQRPFISCSF